MGTTIAWQMYIGPEAPANDDAGWGTFGVSRNDNFITLDRPQLSKLYLTLARNATEPADGQRTVPDTVALMWGQVETLAVRRAEDNTPLYYYGDWVNSLNISLENMLKDTSVFGGIGGNGQCTAWAQYWCGLLYTQGIWTASRVDFVSKNLLVNGENFLVNNWAFGGQNANITIGGISYQWMNASSFSPPYDSFHYLFDLTNAVGDVQGLMGQNQGNPPSAFVYHEVVVYDDLIWDPSYGKIYTDLLDLEMRSVAGYFVRGVSAGTVWYIRQRPPNPDNDPELCGLMWAV